MWSLVKTRLISAIVLAALVLIALFYASEWGVALLVSGVVYAVMYELTKVFNLKGKLTITIANFIFATLFMLISYMGYFRFFSPLVVLYIISLLTISVIDNKKVGFCDVCSSVFLVIYSVAMLIHLAFLRRLDNGVALLILAFLGAYITDTGAYFTGMLIGKHKLIESVSPNKTIEGAIGGVLVTVVTFIVYGVVMKLLGYDVNYIYLVVLSVLCAVIAQLGDLSASVMKRSFSVKDFGNIIPGHGGMLDRVDSLMFVAPIVYHFITFLPVIK